MKLDATPETVVAVAEVFKLAVFLDDRIAAPDKARLAAWSEQVQRHNLTESDLLDGVQTFYDSPRDRAMQAGDLIHHARTAKRARLEARRQAELDAQQSAGDRKAADDLASVAAAFVGCPVTNRTERLDRAETALQCATDRHTATAAIREYFTAKREANRAS